MAVDIDTVFRRAVAAHQRGALQKAETGYLTALKMAPRHADARYNLALILLQTSQWQQALAHLETALKQSPHAADIWFSRGRALSKLGRSAEALASLRKAQDLRPTDPKTLVEIGNELTSQQKLPEAIDVYWLAHNLAPDYVEAAGALAQALIGSRQYEAAAKMLESHLERFADDYRVLSLYGQALYCLGDARGALATLERALKLQPAHQPNRMFALYAAREALQWDREDELVQDYRQAIRGAKPGAEKPTMSHGLLFFPFDNDELFQMAKARADRLKESVRPYQRPATRPNRGGGKLRLGYLSPDYRQHPTIQLIVDLLAAHDRERFDIYAYSIGPLDDSIWRQRAMQAADNFIDLSGLDNPAAAARIAADEIDILIDLSVYTQFSRPEIAALRPAPISVQWVGYPSTSGGDIYDYLIVDEVTVPEEHAHHFSEHLIWVPHCYQPNRHFTALPDAPPRDSVGLPPDAFVFCNFNSPQKTDRDSFLSWCRILKEVDSAVLWLMAGRELYESTLRRYAEENGVARDRLIFAPRLELEQHLARQRCGDLFLDHFVCGAHTTASDALRVGLPLLTLKGTTFASRVAASLLNTAAMPELICDTKEAYEALAIDLARQPERLLALRSRLAASLSGTPLFNVHQFRTDLETGLAHIAAEARRGARKKNIRVSELVGA